MKSAIVTAVLVNCAAWLAFSQSTEPPPRFEAADVRVSKTTNPRPYMRSGILPGGGYQIKTATMVDLVRTAYGFDADKVLGGPSWLEMNRFDVLAKMPEGTTPETQKLMLQALLEDRFKLKVHKDTQPLPTYSLTVGKKPQIKEADGTGETGCKPQSAPAAAQGGGRVMFASADGTTTLSFGPGMTIRYACRNMTMAAFADGLRGMFGASLGPNPILDQTELKGKWNFDLEYSLQIISPLGGDTGKGITISEAVDKQLGLKLEQKQVPTPVIVVDSVNEKPSENPPGTADVVPVIPPATEFEVASVKQSEPGARMMMGFRMQPGGRFVADGMPLGFLINRAFDVNSSDQIAGIPDWANSAMFDIVAKAPAEGAPSSGNDFEALAPLLRSLLVDRFKMTYHTEDRQVTGYALVAAKPKMKKADPASRTSCKTASAPAAGPGGQTMTCQNITMAQFVDNLRGRGPDLTLPILDSTGLEGGWDFSLTFSPMAGRMMGGRGGGAAQAEASVVTASDPTGGVTISEALEKQLGLKLERQKRTMAVIVIDRIEQKPTEN